MHIVKPFGKHADYKSAIRQAASLRYEERVDRGWTGPTIIKKAAPPWKGG
jgi:hypothetical protein